MFRTLSSDADPRDFSDEAEKTVRKDTAADSRSTASTVSDIEEIDHAPSSDEFGKDVDEKRPGTPSSQLKRTTSNALSRVASRMTTKSITDPGPAPDGGFKAWSQVALGWLAIATTWGWINCFGETASYVHLFRTPTDIDRQSQASSKRTTHFTLTCHRLPYLG